MSSNDAIQGIHHITLVCGDAQRTVNFYTQVLGLRFVKRTVNFDDPGSYHLYFGDEVGSPGSAVTFFEWPDAPKGHLLPLTLNIVSQKAPLLHQNAWRIFWNIPA